MIDIVVLIHAITALLRAIIQYDIFLWYDGQLCLYFSGQMTPPPPYKDLTRTMDPDNNKF